MNEFKGFDKDYFMRVLNDPAVKEASAEWRNGFVSGIVETLTAMLGGGDNESGE